MANEAAWQSGVALGSRLAAERRARREALSDREFEYHASLLADELAGNRKQLGSIDQAREPDVYKSKVADLQRNLEQIRVLYHPDHRPDAVSRFGHLITDALKITDPKKRLQKVEARQAAKAAGDRQEAEQLARATPQAANPEREYRDRLVAAGLSPEMAETAVRVRAGVEPKATAPKPEHVSAFDEGFARFLKTKGVDDVEDATFEDEQEYRRALHPASPQKLPHESDFAAGFSRYLRSKGIAPERATAQDEARYRAIIHPVRPLKDLKSEADKRRPARSKKGHSKAYPPYDPARDGPH
jgi:hypothetical protein